MTIDALLIGKLMNQPTQRTSKNGNPFTTCRIRVAGAGAGESDSLLVNCIAFCRRTHAVNSAPQIAAQRGPADGVLWPLPPHAHHCGQMPRCAPAACGTALISVSC